MVNEEARQALKELFDGQRFAVLATQYKGQPYGSLVAFAATENLGSILFPTKRGTRKFANLAEDGRVALVMDNRSNEASDLEAATAATAVGVAQECRGEERQRLEAYYLGKHPQMAGFLREADCALVRVEVERYVLVRQFQEVTEVVMRA
jgi:heme iron utilization protein